ncbi:transporter [Parabacteroides sp. 52]|jgi:outer membrane efflux protein|uniref:TolC family protein n=1 Tax=Bacteroidales TaxID=171549 RepID=UPI00092CB3AB|nr:MULTISPECIES: TolC family protein [Bacteroidales]MDD4591160.1 TolC family protein [Parabacteroides sp.]MDL2262314.1 TolC family protein [Bacteroidales bacterium OttesenSCG-928-I21]OJV74406.1 MAG: transporter [Bacteroidia bacterium 44-10]MCL3850980.1 TolC family protein [Parabacteroides leei]MDC2614788.1 TolC family protein [Bacteroides ovatus]
MRTIIITMLVLFAGITLNAQNNINPVLSSIEENNTTLKALREQVEADKLQNKTGIFLDDPEVGFNYLWGNPSNIGNRTDFSVSQTFDIPTITGMKSRLANGRNNLVEWQYKADRMNILLEAKQYCIELIYYNSLLKELYLRLEHAETIAKGYKDRMDRGDVSILEYNKVNLNLSTIQGEISRMEVERDALLAQLKRLNGGIDVVFNDADYGSRELPLNFNDWYVQAEDKNPVLAYVRNEIEVSQKQVSLSKAMNLPKFTAGYMSEKVVGQRYQGVSLGISIPLWSNKNQVKQAKASVAAAQSREADTKQQFFSQLQIQYSKAMGLKTTADKYRKSLANVNNTILLKKALDAGEISLLDYMVEMGLYYDNVNQTLAAERDYQLAFAELAAVEL